MSHPVIVCKDEAIERYCAEHFGPILTHGHISTDRLRRILTKEAARQQWYDYTEDENGKRTVCRDEEGQPLLLVPEIVIRS